VGNGKKSHTVEPYGRYTKNHSADTYRLYNPVTKHIVVNRDVTRLDWNRLNPARNLSIFKIEPDLLREMGIDERIACHS
jgi:hypothetical protein